MRKEILLVLALTGLLAGCPSTPPAPEDTGATAVGEDEGAVGRGLDAEGVADGRGIEVGTRPGDAALVQQTVIYFDFDTSRVRPEFSEVLAAHARRMTANPDLGVRLEGHADERGSREYNIGLGERRGQAVRQTLMLQGVGAGQITTVSYGEERPAVSGSGEAAWERNRRVEIVYVN